MAHVYNLFTKKVWCMFTCMIICQLTKNHAIKINDDITATRRSKILLYAPQTPLKGHPLRHLIIINYRQCTYSLTNILTILLYMFKMDTPAH